VPLDEVLQAAARRGDEVGCPGVSPGTGAALQALAALAGARAVVEVGTGAGVSGLWLLRGMRPDGVLTSVDLEAEHTRLARESFAQAGIGTPRTRLITGQALEVLPRLADAAYDLMFCDTSPQEGPAYLEQAARLLRAGGVVVFDHALAQDRVADPAQRDPATVATRSLGTTLRDDERFVPALLPVGDGLLLAVKRA
jgi:predicted O-methyltransferase YrrM